MLSCSSVEKNKKTSLPKSHSQGWHLNAVFPALKMAAEQQHLRNGLFSPQTLGRSHHNPVNSKPNAGFLWAKPAYRHQPMSVMTVFYLIRSAALRLILQQPPPLSAKTTLAFLWCSHSTQMSSWFLTLAYITLVKASGFNNTLSGWKYNQLMFALYSSANK